MPRKVYGKRVGRYYHIPIRPKRLFRKPWGTHDVGEPGGLQRVAAIRKDTGEWDTQKYILEVDVADTPRGRRDIETIEEKHGVKVILKP